MVKAEQVLEGGGGRYIAAARKAARVIWHRGLLRKVRFGLGYGLEARG